MRSFVFTLMLAVLSASCEKVIKEERLQPRIETREISCTTPGICGGYGMNSNGDYAYSFGFKLSCPGHQTAAVQVQEVRRTFESGRVAIHEDTHIRNRISRCEQ